LSDTTGPSQFETPNVHCASYLKASIVQLIERPGSISIPFYCKHRYTNSVHKRHTCINKKVIEFVKGKPKGTNPAIMGNPIDMYAVNGSKKQSILLLEKPHLN